MNITFPCKCSTAVSLRLAILLQQISFPPSTSDAFYLSSWQDCTLHNRLHLFKNYRTCGLCTGYGIQKGDPFVTPVRVTPGPCQGADDLLENCRWQFYSEPVREASPASDQQLIPLPWSTPRISPQLEEVLLAGRLALHTTQCPGCVSVAEHPSDIIVFIITFYSSWG
jgi:hypothetical protein